MHVAIQTHKFVEDDFVFVGRYPETMVNHACSHLALFLSYFLDGDMNRSLVWRVAEGIGKQVMQDLLEAGLIGPHIDVCRDIHLDLPLLLQKERLKKINHACADL